MKISQVNADYRQADDPAVSCGTCDHYLGENACEIVAGTIREDMVSAYWEPESEVGEVGLDETETPALSVAAIGPAVAKLARVVVPPYMREKSGHIENVEGYEYNRQGGLARLVPAAKVFHRDQFAGLSPEEKRAHLIAHGQARARVANMPPDYMNTLHDAVSPVAPQTHGLTQEELNAIHERRKRLSSYDSGAALGDFLGGEGYVDALLGPASGYASPKKTPDQLGRFRMKPRGTAPRTASFQRPRGGTQALTTGTRSLSEIAADIRRNWSQVNYAAKPYLDAMGSLDTMKDKYGADDARSIVAYFLSNARGFTGPEAKRIKDELKALLKGAY